MTLGQTLHCPQERRWSFLSGEGDELDRGRHRSVPGPSAHPSARSPWWILPSWLNLLLWTARQLNVRIALIVSPLRQAEEFYRTLFALEVAFREAEAADGWYTLPLHASWDDAEAAGIALGLCSLHRDAFTLALEAGSGSGGGRLSHIGVQVDAEELSRLRVVASTLGCQVVQDGQAILVFDDPYGVRWELTTSSYEDPRRLSTGARKGLWLTIGQERSS